MRNRTIPLALSLAILMPVQVFALGSHPTPAHASPLIAMHVIPPERPSIRVRQRQHIHRLQRLVKHLRHQLHDAQVVHRVVPKSVDNSGDIPAVWDALVQCEAGGNWAYIGSFEGGPNFTNQTWLAYGGGGFAAHANEASPAEQVEVARRVLTTGWQGAAPQGVGAWPVCGPHVGLSPGD